MDSTRYQQVKGIFHELLDLPATARSAALAARCGGDAELRRQVESLLASHEGAGSFLAQPAVEVAAGELLDPQFDPTRASTPRPPPGPPPHPVAADSVLQDEREIGPYRLVESLGQGGMGSVYRAEQVQPVRRTVALKVIKLGMDTREVIARFEAERQALALMDHPCIAKVLDAGSTPRGRPYFVMEYVPGVPITEHADRHALGTVQRLRLFVDVCEAVHHAHQRAIIHRDLKPSNILVMFQDEKATPKIIDFGIAKATNQRLTEATIHTEHGRVIGTPEYMSPEQAEMTEQGIDIRTDVYSLGVILYELLTGKLPFPSELLRAQGYGGLQRTIREVEPPRPSTRVTTLGSEAARVAQARSTDSRVLARQLRGDLDWIVMKAIAKSRTERYESAWSLAEDVRRYLADEPVLATRPGLGYRLRKFVRRNRVAVGTGAAVVLAMAAGLVFALVAYAQLRANQVQLQDALAAAEAAKNRAEVNERLANDKAAEARPASEAAERALAEVRAGKAETAREREARQRQQEETDALVAHSTSVELAEAAAALWPAWPNRAAGIEQWLARAEALVAQRPLLIAVRDRLRESALPPTAGQAQADRESHPRGAELAALEARLAGALPDAERPALEAARAALRTAVAERRTWAFADPDAHRKHAVVTRLLGTLDEWTAEAGLLARMRWRRDEALALGQRSIAAHAAAWQEAAAAAAASPAYQEKDQPPLQLAPQMGLVPLGADPASNLLEFAHLQSGEPALRGPDGRLTIGPQTGIVLVLIPGGRFAMGAEPAGNRPPDEVVNADPDALVNERPVHLVRLAPFFLAKHEMTQAQWERWTGANPSFYRPDQGHAVDPTNPVETVTWFECAEVLQQLGLQLPTEAQWEYAARAPGGAGQARWIAGDAISSLRGFANLAMRDSPAKWAPDQTFADGFVVHAPVATLAPSPRGLHHVLGNVSEWCFDDYGDYTAPVRTEDGLRRTAASPQRPHRGGSFRDLPYACRVSARTPDPAKAPSETRGVRPARALQR